MKKEMLSVIIFFVSIILLGCTNQISQTNSTAIANPASEKCVKDGGKDKVLDGPNGQYGLCLFNDGSVCEEWDYFNGKCSKGECMRKCDQIGTRSEGWYDCNGKLLFWDLCANESAATANTC